MIAGEGRIRAAFDAAKGEGPGRADAVHDGRLPGLGTVAWQWLGLTWTRERI